MRGNEGSKLLPDQQRKEQKENSRTNQTRSAIASRALATIFKTESMKKRVNIQALLIISSIFCFGQVSHINSPIPDSELSNFCHKPIENKTIGICNIKTDTLTYDQLKKCKELTIGEDNKEFISSYNFGYSLDTSTFVQRFVGSNQIPNDMVTIIVAKRIKKIIISGIKGDDGKEKFDLGFRCFYIKY